MTDHTNLIAGLRQPSANKLMFLAADAIAQQAAEIAALKAGREWRPIAGAPKDGTKVLAFYDHEADEYFIEDGKRLTPYAAHAEGGDYLGGKGIAIVSWSEGWTDGSPMTGDECHYPAWRVA